MRGQSPRVSRAVPANSNCLNALESGGMGEGWGDFIATTVRLKPADTRATNYPMAVPAVMTIPRATGSTSTAPRWTTNPPHLHQPQHPERGPRHRHDLGHRTLYELLWNLIDKHGKNDAHVPTFDSARVPTDGKYLTLKIVIDALAL